MVSLDSAKPRVGRDQVKPEDLVDLYKLPPNKWVMLRLLPSEILPIKRHWISIIAGRDKREVKIPKICVSFDPSNEGDVDGVHCPYCDLAEGGRGEVFYLANAIIRQLQKTSPARRNLPPRPKQRPASRAWKAKRGLRFASYA